MEYSIEETHRASNDDDSAELTSAARAESASHIQFPSFILASKVLYLTSSTFIRVQYSANLGSSVFKVFIHTAYLKWVSNLAYRLLRASRYPFPTVQVETSVEGHLGIDK